MYMHTCVTISCSPEIESTLLYLNSSSADDTGQLRAQPMEVSILCSGCVYQHFIWAFQFCQSIALKQLQ